MQKDPDIINIIVDEGLDEAEDTPAASKATMAAKISKLSVITDFFKKLFKNLSPEFIKISCMICAGIILISLGLGFIIPKSDNAVSKSLEALRRSNKSYLSAKNDYDTVSSELAKLNKELEDKQQSMNDIDKTQSSLDKITQENDELSKEAEALQNEVDTKQQTLDSLEKSSESYDKTSIVWSSGTYTAGKNISPGKYTVTGSGSIVISNSGNARVNTKLKSDGASYTLLDGDIIKIDGNAKFVSE